MAPDTHNVDLFGDVPVTLEVRIASRESTLRQVAGLAEGGILPLDKPAGETLDVFIGDLLLGTAEVIVVEDRLAIRMTDLLLPDSPATATPAS